jgi:hypothetical protein
MSAEADMTIDRNRTRLALAGALALCLSGCMSVAERVHADAQQAVRKAEALGSADTPSAAYELALARSELARGEQFAGRGEPDWASQLFERAKADADLAIALHREDQARSAALRTHTELDQLHDAEQGTTGETLRAAPTPTTSSQ